MFYIKRKLIISRKVLCDFESYRNRTCKSCSSCPTNNSNARQTASSKKADDKQLQQAQIADLQFYADLAEKGKVEFKQYTPLLLEDQERAIADENASEKTTAKTANTSRTAQIPLPAEPIYYYHPDHLGTSTFLTDANGNAYQFFLNLPFGETMAEQLGNSYYKSPYKFNGKELDQETGLYYYGARYYNPKTSVWLSVDPLAEEFPGVNPYNYCFSNPINLIDPTGMGPDDWVEYTGKNGQQQIIYDSSVKTMDEAKAKYDNVKQVFEAGTGKSAKTGEVVNFQKDGTYSVNGGKPMNVDDTSYTTKGGTYIGENKGIVDAIGDFGPGALQKGGDAITKAAGVAALSGAEPVAVGLASVGGTMSAIGAGGAIINDAVEGKFDFKNAAIQAGSYFLNKYLKGISGDDSVKKIMLENGVNEVGKGMDELNKKN